MGISFSQSPLRVNISFGIPFFHAIFVILFLSLSDCHNWRHCHHWIHDIMTIVAILLIITIVPIGTFVATGIPNLPSLWVVIVKKVLPSRGSIGSIIMDPMVVNGNHHWRQWQLWPPLAPLSTDLITIGAKCPTYQTLWSFYQNLY